MAEWIIITKVAQFPTLAPTHARRRRHHSSTALSMTLWSIAAAKHPVNAAITFYDFNCLNAYQRNYKAGKFKVFSWLSYSYGNLTGSCDILFFCIFFQICAKFELLNSQR